MGFASSLHCAGMCGGIVSALFLSMGKGQGPVRRALVLGSIQVGRIGSYAMMGSVAGALGFGVLGHFDHPTLYLILRSFAALSLGWVGFTLTGFAPRMATLDRIFVAVSGAVRSMGAMLPLPRLGKAMVSGMAWGLLPCGMVYSALLLAMATGTVRGGSMVMLGFGLGTLPSILMVALGVAWLRALGEKPGLQIAIGVALIMLASATVLIPPRTFELLCGH